jgi:hypothetical protein
MTTYEYCSLILQATSSLLWILTVVVSLYNNSLYRTKKLAKKRAKDIINNGRGFEISQDNCDTVDEFQWTVRYLHNSKLYGNPVRNVNYPFTVRAERK